MNVMLGALRRAATSGVLVAAARSFSTEVKVTKKVKAFSRGKLALVVPVSLLGGWIVTSEHPQAAAALALHFPLRLGRDIICAGLVVEDYLGSLKGLEGEDREVQKHLCHLRGADRIQNLCFANGGIYIKLGQVAAQMDHLLPEEYVTTFKENLLDKCPVSSYLQVARTMNEDLGSPPSALFAEFEETPIASASLAQVHLAKGFDGKDYAVKVQHAGLRDTYAADVATVSVIVNLVHYFFPEYDYTWLVKEIKATLPKELDFEVEAENAERCRKNFNSPKSRMKNTIHIPEITHELSAKRVLTMEYVQGVKVNQKEELLKRHIKPQEVARIVAEAFNEMIFTFGDVHCDPHAANMMVRLTKGGKPQVVLLDHGLYKQIPDELRLDYAALWQALIFGDPVGIKKYAERMHAGEMYPLFAAMLTSRPWDDITKRTVDHLHIPDTPEEKEKLQGHAKEHSKEINQLLGSMPPDLLLLFKTNDCLRSVDRSLGQPVNTFVIAAKECTRALADSRLQQSRGLRTWLSVKADGYKVEMLVCGMKIMAWWSSLKRRLLIWPFSLMASSQ